MLIKLSLTKLLLGFFEPSSWLELDYTKPELWSTQQWKFARFLELYKCLLNEYKINWAKKSKIIKSMREKAYTQKEKLGCYLNELNLTLVGSPGAMKQGPSLIQVCFQL